MHLLWDAEFVTEVSYRMRVRKSSAVVYTIRGLSSSQSYAARTELYRLVVLVAQTYE
jgi:hypothetical protein